MNSKSIEGLLKNLLSIQTNVLSVKSLMIITGWSKGYIYKLTSKGVLPFYKPNNKTIFFKKDEIENWLCRNKVKSSEEIEAEASTFINEKMVAL